MNNILKMHWFDYYRYNQLKDIDRKMSNSRNGIELEYREPFEGSTHYSYKIIDQELFTIFILKHSNILTNSKIIAYE
jgi:hypothetical protein